jgi:hypothetical protein
VKQLQQQAEANAERLAQISQQAAEERKQLDESFIAQLAAEGLHNENWLKIQDARQKASLALFDEWWGGVNKRFAEQGPMPQMGPLPQASGWLTDFNGGRSQPAASFPTGFNQVMGGGTRSVSISEGAIQIYGAPGQSEEMIARLVREEMITLLEWAQ